MARWDQQQVPALTNTFSLGHTLKKSKSMIQIDTVAFNPEKPETQHYLTEVRRRLTPFEKDIVAEGGKLSLDKDYPDKTGIRMEGFSDHLMQKIRLALAGGLEINHH